ncbi:Per os infectivity factor 3 [Trabala vishnou gigantina nucleopolyhedrovirus]|uniref:Per os infectivity factor 3 n=1 Tax=Trabala vishnou gigantina nucleopolyhedrovirus TaxID=2863583 RepID=UPI0024819D08|nr:Per os infectivity factor 3 [Trabala vishnou gigantina nucleopolyhedrovirus]QYC92743.1 Per os infectivity factor 3 [Trabala vishnou gigantina nucleopolyhedrovirus]
MYYACYAQAINLIRLQTIETETAVNNSMQFVYEQNGVVDCVQTKLPCVTDRQCVDNCIMQNAIGVTVCEEGFCTNVDANVSGRPDDFECDAALGLIKVFAASEFVVNQFCISTYRDIIDDLGKTRPYVCDNGILNIDLVNRQFSPSDCACVYGHTKLVYDQTAFARSIPVCVPNSLTPIYKRIYE